MFRGFRVPTTATRRPFSNRSERGPSATQDQDLPAEGEDVSTVATKKEAAIKALKSKVASSEDTVTYRWTKFEELMSKVMDTELDVEDEKAILAEATTVEKEAREAERIRDGLKLQLTAMTGEDGGYGGESSGGGGNGGDSSGGGGSG